MSLTEPSTIELTAEFDRVFWSSSDSPRWIAGSATPEGNGDESITVCGNAEEDDLVPGLSYRFYGKWKDHPKYGRGFDFQTFVLAQPHGRRGVIRYLRQLRGVGEATATELWRKFQSDAVKILREQPDVAAAAVSRFTLAKATLASEQLQGMQVLEACSIDLLEVIDGRGFPKVLARMLIRDYGNQAAAKIQQNPYLLMRYRGIGFSKSDKLYLDLGKDPARLKRQTLCIVHALASDTNGHTWHPVDKGITAIRESVGSAKHEPVKAIKLGKRSKLIATRRDNAGKLWIADGAKANNEMTIARQLRMLENDGHYPTWPCVDDLDLIDDHQRARLYESLRGFVGVFGGSPGTGKTFTVAQLIAVLLKTMAGGVAVAAPTGKAAVRLTEAMVACGVHIKATTIHPLLGVQLMTNSDGGGSGWVFVHNQK